MNDECGIVGDGIRGRVRGKGSSEFWVLGPGSWVLSLRMIGDAERVRVRG